MSKHEARSFRFARNVSWTVLGQLLLGVVNLALVPVVVRGLGLEAYGLYILLQTASGYLMLLSFGTGAALLRWVSFGSGRGHGRMALDAARFTLWVHLFGTLAGGLALVAFAQPVLSHLLRLAPEQMATAVFVVRCAAAGTVFAALTQAGWLVLQGVQRFDEQSLVTVLQGALSLGAAAALASSGRGVKAVAAAWVAVNAFSAALSLFMARGALEPLRERADGPPLPPRDFMRWSISAWLGPLAWPIVNQLDRVIIARSSSSLAGVTLYAIPANLLQRLQLFPALIGSVLSPMMIELDGHTAEHDLARIYLKSVRLVLWALLPPLIVLFAVMPQFLSLWLGGRFGDASVWPARLLVLAQIFWLLGTVPGSVTFAKDKPWYTPAYGWAQAILSVLAWKLFVGKYQLLGVAGGSLIAQILPVVVLLSVVHKRVLNLRFSRYVGALLAPAASGLLTFALAFPLHVRVTTWPRLFGLSAASAALFYASTWWFMGHEDRGVFTRYLRHRFGSGIV